MQVGGKMKQVIAVRCAICSTLHDLQDITYSLVWGGAKVSVNQREPLNFGTPDEPTVICANVECLQRLFKTIDKRTYDTMQALGQKVKKQNQFEAAYDDDDIDDRKY